MSGNETRRYGDNNTIHNTELVHVETDSDGNVVSVWFRCQMLPFQQVVVDSERARSMQTTYASGSSVPGLVAVELRDA